MKNIMILIEGVHTYASPKTNEYSLENNDYVGDTSIYTWLLASKITENLKYTTLQTILDNKYALVETCYGLKIVKIKSFKIVKDTDLKEVNLLHGMELKYAIKIFSKEEIELNNPRIDRDEIFGHQDEE